MTPSECNVLDSPIALLCVRARLDALLALRSLVWGIVWQAITKKQTNPQNRNTDFFKAGLALQFARCRPLVTVS